MALKGTLKIENEVFTLIECEYHLSKKVSVDGLPEDGTHVGTIFVTIATPSNGVTLHEWVLNDYLKKDGILSFVTNVNTKKPAVRTIVFQDAYCTDLFEYFNGQNSVMMATRIAISARKVLFGDGSGMGIGLDNDKKTVIEGATPFVKDRTQLF